ncbi:protein NUCLEAR FUSION DEFECTIVE 6, mitochondrial-like [Bidens hawaiensis]|uniref:protein NUCLEAR FUSION DEFECTIVE 6, mitochondrial-like n=1 Tax=Bidens hawaiensis TaxID=980011 RepID=UPI00404940F6
MSAVRLFTRSTSVRNAAAKISSGVKTTVPRLPATKPLSHRIFSCPVELSVCLETVQPFRTVTEPGLMPSVLVLSRSSYCWIPEGS